MSKNTVLVISAAALLAQPFEISAQSDQAYYEDSSAVQTIQTAPTTPFTPFTGKVTRNKVRLRVQPNLDGPIIKELKQGDMLIVIGDTEDFYAVQPPSGIKSYIFRTYVLDNIVEATRVNVRLEPDLEAPVIGQLVAGDRVDGIVSPLNNKWLEIAPPANARFYVAKDYVEKIGDTSMMGAIEKRRDEVNILLNNTFLAAQKELQKSFPEINLDTVYANLNKIINDYKDFPEQVDRARELLNSTQDNYLQKKIAFLESKTKIVQDDWQAKNSQLNDQMKAQQQKLSQLESQLKRNKGEAPYLATKPGTASVNNKMTAWTPVEETLFQEWLKTNDGKTQDDFYTEQNEKAVVLQGIVEPYNRVIKNKPGDYVLVNRSNHLPVAYIYSTKINLQDKIGQEVTIYGAPRSNNNFAFPAYFVLSVE